MTPGGSCDGAAGSAPPPVTSTSGSKSSTEGGGGAAMKKGPWTAAEDAILMEYVRKYGEGNWNAVQKNSGLSRCGKSCRLRWANHLRPNLKKGPFSPDEERLILELHSKMGNKWARMAAQLPGRTDNEIKNYWNTRIKRRQRAGLPLYPPDIQHQTGLHHRPTPAGPLSDHKALYSTSIGATPLSLLDPTNFEAPPAMASPSLAGALGHHPPLLASGHPQRFKRLRDDDMGGFSLPFGTNPVAPPPPPSHIPMFPFSVLGGYDLTPPPPPQQQQQQQQCFSVKMELPSSQLFAEPSTAGSLHFGRCNSELLDALLRDTQPIGDGKGGDHQRGDGFPPEPNGEQAKWVKENADGAGGELSQGLVLGTAGGKWDGSNNPIDTVMKREAAENAGSVDDDLSALLDLIPMASIPATTAAAAAMGAAREWYNGDSGGEVSNGQSSGVTDDNVGLEMQQLASSLSMATEEDHSWSIGSCQWHDMAGTC